MAIGILIHKNFKELFQLYKSVQLHQYDRFKLFRSLREYQPIMLHNIISWFYTVDFSNLEHEQFTAALLKNLNNYLLELGPHYI